MASQSESRFWDKFISKTTSYNIKPGAARWYVRHAESYIKSHEDRLSSHSEKDVEKYLAEKGRNQFLHDWQFRQIVTAIRILFTEMVSVPWGKEFPWDEWIDKSETLENNHPTVARDYVSVDTSNIGQQQLENRLNGKGLYKKVYAKYPNYIEDLIKSIRIKHYSYRTEQSYLD